MQTPRNRSKGCRAANKNIKINLFDKKRLKNGFINFAIVRKWAEGTPPKAEIRICLSYGGATVIYRNLKTEIRFFDYKTFLNTQLR